MTSAGPVASAEATAAYDPSTKPDDTPTGLAPVNEPPATQAEPAAPARHKSLSFLQPGSQPGSLAKPMALPRTA